MNQGLLLSVAGALLFGSYLVVVKRYFDHYPPPLYITLTNATGLLWYLPIAALTAPPDALPASLDLGGVAVLLGTAAFTGFALLAFFHAITVGEVSYVAPLSKIVPVFVLPIEVLVLGQHLSPVQVGGVVVATVAVYVANWRAGELWEPLARAASNRAAGFALLSAALFGVVDVGKRLSMQELAVAPQAFVPIMLGGVLVLVAPLALRERDAVPVRPDLPKIVGAGALVAVGQHIVSVAFQTLPASVVSPVVNTQAVVAVVLGSLLLGESHFRIRLLAAGLAVGGVTLITVG